MNTNLFFSYLAIFILITLKRYYLWFLFICRPVYMHCGDMLYQVPISKKGFVTFMALKRLLVSMKLWDVSIKGRFYKTFVVTFLTFEVSLLFMNWNDVTFYRSLIVRGEITFLTAESFFLFVYRRNMLFEVRSFRCNILTIIAIESFCSFMNCSNVIFKVPNLKSCANTFCAFMDFSIFLFEIISWFDMSILSYNTTTLNHLQKQPILACHNTWIRCY